MYEESPARGFSFADTIREARCFLVDATLMSIAHRGATASSLNYARHGGALFQEGQRRMVSTKLVASIRQKHLQLKVRRHVYW